MNMYGPRLQSVALKMVNKGKSLYVQANVHCLHGVLNRPYPVKPNNKPFLLLQNKGSRLGLRAARAAGNEAQGGFHSIKLHWHNPIFAMAATTVLWPVTRINTNTLHCQQAPLLVRWGRAHRARPGGALTGRSAPVQSCAIKPKR